MQEQLKKFIERVVKAEIHLHLEGCIQLETLWQLYQKNNVQIEGISTKEDLAQRYAINNLNEFIDFFINILQNCICEAEDIKFYFTDLKDYMKRNNVRYAELFFSPSQLLRQGVKYPDIADTLNEGAADLAAHGYNCQFLIDVSRSFGPKNAMENLDNILAHPRSVIIGIGLGGAERNGPAKEYQAVFAKAREHKLYCVAHAGEDVGPQSIWDSIDLLNAQRIGHGISAMEDAELRKEMKQRQIPLEICVTSNLFTKRFVSKAAEHPIRLFYDEGLPLTLNSDDPMLFHSELCDEYLLLVEKCGFEGIDILRIMENNVMMSFMAQEIKQRFIHNIRETAREYQLL